MTYTLTLTEQDMQVLNDALIERPFKDVVLLIQKINQQARDSVEKESPNVAS